MYSLFHCAAAHGDRTAVITGEGSFTYAHLLSASAAGATRLLNGAADLHEARVAYLVPPSYAYVATQWSVWRAGGVAVPLAVSYPPAELEYVLDDTGASIVVAHPEMAERVRPLAEARGLRFLLTTSLLEGSEVAVLPELEQERRAMILYTSGTTSRPKGVVTTHGNIEAQVTTLVAAWGWQADDHIPLFLPLHHVHGIINVLTCALWVGAKVTILPKFEADVMWNLIADGGLSVFMAVPTIYSRLIAAWEGAGPERQAALSAGCRKLRLMVSGSAALPVPLLKKWEEISGHVLLERYGMTEIGMALSNPLDGERRPGFVGPPLPGVRIQLVDEAGRPVEPGTPGEIEVAGPSVFQEYWRRPEATHAAFRDGWFRTGDMAVLEDGSYRILGRTSVDIIKTGGYKVSALEIEEVFLAHPDIREHAVVGVSDPEWGQRVSIAAAFSGGREVTLDELRRWGAERLAPYKLPSRLVIVDELPRNAMGKVKKPDVVKLFEA